MDTSLCPLVDGDIDRPRGLVFSHSIGGLRLMVCSWWVVEFGNCMYSLTLYWVLPYEMVVREKEAMEGRYGGIRKRSKSIIIIIIWYSSICLRHMRWLYHLHICTCTTKQQLKQATHLCHSILNLGQDKATARYGYHSLAVILTRTRTMESI